MTKSLDEKLADIHANPDSKAFIIADAKDADMAFGVAAPGKSPEHEDGGFRSLAEFRESIRQNTRQELLDIINTAERLRAQAIVTTEKDAVRFPKLDRCDVPVYFLRVDIEILTGEEDFRDCISRVCFRTGSRGGRAKEVSSPDNEDVAVEEAPEREKAAEVVPA